VKYRSIAGVVLAVLLMVATRTQAAGPQMTVYKSRTCGCCGKWVEHLRSNGFDVKVQEVDSTAEYQQKYGVPRQFASCHTAVVNGYTIEGHVPAREIHRLLRERPGAKGLAVPGMPIGSPGMEGGRNEAYTVVLFDVTGRGIAYQNYPGGK
jgi:hypothetical protein